MNDPTFRTTDFHLPSALTRLATTGFDEMCANPSPLHYAGRMGTGTLGFLGTDGYSLYMAITHDSVLTKPAPPAKVFP